MHESINPEKLASILDGLCDYYQRGPLSRISASIYWESLKGYSVAEISHGIRLHIADTVAGSYFPKVADILRHVAAVKSVDVIGADEAWAMCYRLTDERESVVITGAMREAWAIAWPVLDGGDEVGARVAFKDAYKRLTAQQHAQAWELQPGTDAQLRALAVSEAVQLGRLPASALSVHALPAPTNGIAGLLEHADDSEERQAQALAMISAIKAMLARGKPTDDNEAETKAREFEAHRSAELVRLNDYAERRKAA